MLSLRMKTDLRQGADDRVNSLSLNGSKTLHVAQELVGMLIGRGGETIKASATVGHSEPGTHVDGITTSCL